MAHPRDLVTLLSRGRPVILMPMMLGYAAWLGVFAIGQPAEPIAAPPVAAPAPAPAPTEIVAPAPAPAEIVTPAPADTVAPPPADTVAPPPADTIAPPPTAVEAVSPASPPDEIVTPAPAPITDVANGGWDDPAPAAAPVTPRAVPTESGAFVLVPAIAPPRVQPIPPDVTIRRWRRNAGLLAGIGGATLLGSFALQGLRHAALRHCGNDTSCQLDALAYEPSLGTYTVMFHAMTVGAAGGAGVMLGNAAATNDVHARGHAVAKPGVLALGVVIATAGTIAYVTSGLGLYMQQMRFDADDPASLQLRRFLLVDSLVLATSVGSGMIGYAVGRKRHGQALAKIRVHAGPTAGGLGGGIGGRF